MGKLGSFSNAVSQLTLLRHTAIGDARGAGLEYATADYVLEHNATLSGYVRNQRHNLQPGYYTDDTQMALAVAEVIMRCVETGTPLTREAFADHFVECFQRDVREGYAGGFYNFLSSVADGEEFLLKIKPYSDKSGGAMRAVPVGIFPTISQVKTVSALQAALTHNTTDGINASVAASLMGHFFAYDLGPKEELGAFIEKWVPGDWTTPWTEPVGEKGWMSVRAALTAIKNNSTLSGLLKACIAFTGDVDTVAAIALGAAAASREFAHDLPEVLIEQLENGSYGRDYLDTQDKRLSAAMKKLRESSSLARKVAGVA